MPLPPHTRVVHFSGPVSSVELTNVMKTAMDLSRPGESTITVDLCLALKGEISDHSVNLTLNELRGRVANLNRMTSSLSHE